MRSLTIYGSSSMAGHILKDYFSAKDIYCVDCKEVSEIFDENFKIRKEFQFSDSDYIINCIRCLVEESELNPLKAIMYNSYFPRLIEKEYQKTKTQIIQLSTDCVFSGLNGDYDESIKPDASTNYARTKILGEIINNKDITIRTSYIGPTIHHDEELFDWFLMQVGQVKGYTNAFWTGITTLELAKGIEKLIELKFTGLYHMIPNEKISKHQLLVLIKDIWKKNNIIIKKDGLLNIDRSLKDCRKMIKIKNYEDMFFELHQYMKDKNDLYLKYKLF